MINITLRGRRQRQRGSFQRRNGRHVRQLRLESLEARLLLATFTVNSEFGDGDSFLGDNICDTRNRPDLNPPIPPSGICTLNAALEQANAIVGQDTIRFTQAGRYGGGSELEANDSVLIDGAVDSGVTMVRPLLVLTADGNDITRVNTDIEIRSGSGSRVMDVESGFRGITIRDSSGNTVQNSMITGPLMLINSSSNTIERNSFREMTIDSGSAANLILGNTLSRSSGSVVLDGAPRLVFEDNDFDPGRFEVLGNGATGTEIWGNQIGSLTIRDAFNVSIGNSTAGNTVGTLRIERGSGARIEGNHIGFVEITDSDIVSIGGNSVDDRNVIPGGVRVRGQNHVGPAIVNNFIGTDDTGTLDGQPGAGIADGISIEGAAGTVIRDNLIAAMGRHGILITGASAGATIIQGNTIGLDVSGLVRLENRGSGIVIENAANNLIGGSNPGEGNIISGNGGGNFAEAGVVIRGPDAHNNVIIGNYIGPPTKTVPARSDVTPAKRAALSIAAC